MKDVTRSYLEAAEAGDVPRIELVNACKKWLKKYRWRFWVLKRHRSYKIILLLPKDLACAMIGEHDAWMWSVNVLNNAKNYKSFVRAVKQTASGN